MGAAYDLAALGSGLATTLAAALAARRGQRVLLAPGRRPHATFRHGPHLLDARLQLLSGLSRPLARQVLSELQLDRFVDERITPFTPPLQLLLPGACIDVGPDDEALLDELDRERLLLPAEAERMLFQLARASRIADQLLRPESGWPVAQTPDLEGVELDLPRAPLPMVLIRGPASAVSPVVPDDLGPVPLARLLSSWRQGSCALVGGLASVELALHELLLAAGGEIIADSDPLGLLTSPQGSPRGVMLEGRPGTLLARQFVLGLSPRRLRAQSMLGLQLPWLAAPEEVARRHILHLFFRRGRLPASMGDLLLLVPRLADGQTLLGLVSDPTLTSDEVVLSVQEMLPLSRCTTDGLRQAETRVLELVRRVVPFFDEAFVGACSPHREHSVPMESVVALTPDPRQPSLLAGIPSLPLDPGLGNTALVHSSVLGALGTEGSFAAAWSAVQMLSGET